MDFVVVGFGLGALGVLLGVVMLGWLAPRSQRAAAARAAADDVADDAARHRAVAAEHHGTGQAFLYAGGAMLLATVAGLLGSLDDRTGAFLVTTTATVAAVGILLGGYLQRARNPVPPRRRPLAAPVASASPLTASSLAGSPSLFADEPARTDDPVAPQSDVEGPYADVLPVSDSAVAFTADEMAAVPSAASAPLSSGTTDPGPLDESPLAADTADSESWQPADRTEASTSRPDEDDPSSGGS